MVCLGDSQHLRSFHGGGFFLELSLDNESIVSNAVQFVQSHFNGATIAEQHSQTLNFEIPANGMPKLSSAFATLEQHKDDVGIKTYSLSQSTLEQVFLKKIQTTSDDLIKAEEFQAELLKIVPNKDDYIYGYIALFIALIIPGFHHFYLGNTSRGFKYLFTWNEVYAGWVLDLLEMRVLIKKSVETYGHTNGVSSLFPCCRCCCCCCCCRNATKPMV